MIGFIVSLSVNNKQAPGATRRRIDYALSLSCRSQMFLLSTGNNLFGIPIKNHKHESIQAFSRTAATSAESTFKTFSLFFCTLTDISFTFSKTFLVPEIVCVIYEFPVVDRDLFFFMSLRETTFELVPTYLSLFSRTESRIALSTPFRLRQNNPRKTSTRFILTS